MPTIECRPCRPDDDLAALARCLYETDAYIYPHVCGEDLSAWQRMVAQCLLRPDNVFYYGHLLVALCDGHIVGIICIIPGGQSFAFDRHLDVPPQLAANVASVQEGYFDPLMALNLRSKGYNITNVCVLEEYRGKQIGSRLIEYCVSLYGHSDILLEVIADNEVAITLYEHHGFRLWSRQNGYAPDGQTLPCCLYLRSPETV